MSLTYGSLFAGYGGLEMGVRSVLGGELSWFAEFDKAPSAIMAHHHPGVPNLGDVTRVDWHSVPPVDVITGGSPCQDLSHAGKRAGMKAGTRSGLWASMCDAIDIIRPRLVVWENVRGALSAEADSALELCAGCVGDGDDGPVLRALGRVLGDLAELRYDAWWYGLRAADVGAPHGRFREFLYATPADADSHGLEGLGWLRAVGRDAHGLHRAGQAPAGLTLLPTPAVNDMGAAYTPETWDEWTARMKAAHGNGNGHGKSLAVEAQRLLPTPRTSDTNGAGHHGQGGPDLRTVAALLPTPSAAQGSALRTSHSDYSDLGRSIGALITNGETNGDPTEADAAEALRDVRDTDGTEALRQEARGLRGVHEEAPLLPELREQSPRGDEGCAPLASPATPEGLLPDLLGDNGSARAPQGPGSHEQRPVEPGDAVRVVPPSSALARGPRCPHGCGEACGGHSSVAWGEYEAAIRGWEVRLGRPAPDPTSLGARGQPRLSAEFVEFLMGLPAGHVTDPAIGISRNDQLKALGNGVVPQQCAAATRAFIHDISREAAA